MPFLSYFRYLKLLDNKPILCRLVGNISFIDNKNSGLTIRVYMATEIRQKTKLKDWQLGIRGILH